MELQSLLLRNSLLLLTSLLALPAFRAAAQSKPDAVGAATSQAPAIPARITQPIDETQLVRLRGNELRFIDGLGDARGDGWGLRRGRPNCIRFGLRGGAEGREREK